MRFIRVVLACKLACKHGPTCMYMYMYMYTLMCICVCVCVCVCMIYVYIIYSTPDMHTDTLEMHALAHARQIFAEGAHAYAAFSC